MKRNTLIVIIVVIQLFFLKTINAEIRLPAIISSNMVLQRNAIVKLWGWADSNEKISIEVSWLDSVYNFKADIDGNWLVELKTTNDKTPQTIHIKSTSSDFTMENILLGEVWLCSGQSNMQHSVKGYEAEPTFGSNLAIAKSNNPNLRLFSVEMAGSKIPLKDVEKYKAWQSASPETVPDFSAIAYYFGKQLQEILDCPVGLILSTYGGSSVQTWISEEMLSSYQKVNLEDTEITLQGCRHAPTVLFNAMINPLIPFTIKGALWYQGEENRREPENYKRLFPAMVNDWRTRWNIGDFPFYYVQIAPFVYSNNNDSFQDDNNSAFIREAQLQCLDLIPNSGIVVTLDIGDDYCIHPPIKKEVADRLLFHALNQTYGYKTVECTSPVYDSIEVKDGGIVLKFINAENGLFTYDALHDFEIAAEDKVFYPATARIGMRKDIINRNEVFVKSDDVSNPVAVRYAWRNFVVGTLFGNNFLPVSSFRTDNWNDATRFEK